MKKVLIVEESDLRRKILLDGVESGFKGYQSCIDDPKSWMEADMVIVQHLSGCFSFLKSRDGRLRTVEGEYLGEAILEQLRSSKEAVKESVNAIEEMGQ